MSTVFSKLKEEKELHDKILPKLHERYITKQIPRIVGIIASCILVLVYLNQYCDVLDHLKITAVPSFSDSANTFISRCISTGGIIWAGYHFVIYNLLLKLIIHIDTIKEKTYIRLLNTLNDVIEIVASGIYFVYALGELLCVVNIGYTAIEFRILYFCAFIYLAALFVDWVYRKNDYNPYTMRTGYCDNNLSIIYEEDIVSYYNKLYMVESASKIILGDKNRDIKDPYLLRPLSRSGDEISLEEATSNKEGNLTVIYSGKMSR